MRGVNLRNATGPQQTGPSQAEQAAQIASLQKQHTDLMYANSALLKTVKYVAISFGVISAGLIVYNIWFNKPTAAAPAYAAPMPAPLAPIQSI